MAGDAQPVILFEHPLNERCRMLLRLSRLFTQFEQHLGKESPSSSKTALMALLDVAAVLSRPDIKSELIKELDRQATLLTTLMGHPDADEIRVGQVLAEVTELGDHFKRDPNQLGQSLRKSEFLSSVTHRLSVPGGTFEFDLPQLHYWLSLPHSERVMQLDGWREEVVEVQGAVDLMLTLIRESAHTQHLVAERGFFQQNLDPRRIIQMVQVGVDPELGVYPEISGSKHRFCVRFLEAIDWESPNSSTGNIPFQARICAG